VTARSATATGVRVAAAVAVVLVLVATGVASYRLRDADPRPAILQTDATMRIVPTWVRAGARVQVRFSVTRSRTGLLTATGATGDYLLDDGRLARIPRSGRFGVNFSGETRSRSFTTSIPARLPPGRYRVCSLNLAEGGPSLAECVPLTVLSG
jgi:hypothetical protein